MSTVARRLGRVIPLPNIKLRLNPPRYESPADASLGVDEVVFVTTPDVTKLEVRNFLETVHDIRVVDVRTANYEGKKKRDRGGFHRRADTKKVYVTLRERWFPPSAFALKPQGGSGDESDSTPSSDGA
jgi:large subunit ribosomal protein L23